MSCQLTSISENTETAEFDCGDDDLNDFLHNNAINSANKWVSATHVLYNENHLAGFLTTAWDSLQNDKVSDNDRLHNYSYAKYPAIKLARLGVDITCQTHGVETELMISFFKIAKLAVNYGEAGS